jgi:predicted nucleotidyltransferase
MDLPPTYQAVIDRFIAACRDDRRVLAASLAGSFAAGTADAQSDLDLDLVTTDDGYEAFRSGRAMFLRRLGEPIFLEDFDVPGMAFFVFADGVEGELAIGRESDRSRLHAGPYRVLLDKSGILTGAPGPWPAFTPSDQREAVRRLVTWFWHDLSHFATAMARRQLWWAHGQLDDLRRSCVDLLWAEQDVTRRPKGFEKVEMVVPSEQLAPLAETYCPLDFEPMLRAGEQIVRFFQGKAPALAEAHGVPYPAALERIMTRRLTELSRPEAQPSDPTTCWTQFSDPRFDVRFRYPTVTPRGDRVERQESQEGDALRVHVLSAGRDVYFEVRRYPSLTGEEEYRRHSTHLRGRFSDLVLSDLTATHHGAHPAHTYSFSWGDGERVVLLIPTAGALHRVIYNPRAPLNHTILATLAVRESAGGGSGR